MRQFYFSAILFLLAISDSQAQEKLKNIYSWKALEFAFPNEYAKLAAIKSRSYIPGASLPIDVDVYNTGTNEINNNKASCIYFLLKFIKFKFKKNSKIIYQCDRKEK